MRDRRDNLCYYCEAKWNSSYKCQKSKLYLIEKIYGSPVIENTCILKEKREKVWNGLSGC